MLDQNYGYYKRTPHGIVRIDYKNHIAEIFSVPEGRWEKNPKYLGIIYGGDEMMDWDKVSIEEAEETYADAINLSQEFRRKHGKQKG